MHPQGNDPGRTESALRADAEAAFRAALAAAEPGSRVADWLHSHPERARPPGRLEVVALGKAAPAMIQGAARARSLDPDRVLVVTKDGHGAELPSGLGELREAGHPLPDERSLAAGEAILQRARQLGPQDELLVLISGGASALAEVLPSAIALADWLAASAALVEGGLPIQKINAVRKHCSRLKGGQLARAAAPATVTALLLSDVIGDDPAVIGSGPTAEDPSTYAEALAVTRGLPDFPESVARYLESGQRGELVETPKAGELGHSANVVVASNRQALAAAQARLEAEGYRTLVLSGRVQGEAREVARVLAAVALESRASGAPAPAPAAFLWGGETTVTIRGEAGEGGRNQELAVAMAPDLAGWAGIGALCAGTDGTDGPTDAAGGWVDGSTVARARVQGREIGRTLAAHDSGPLLEALDDRMVTGPTGTNVMDLAILLVGRNNGAVS